MARFTNAEYADIVYVYGFCDGNARQAVREYRRRFPDRETPHRGVFTSTFRRLRETGSFSCNRGGNRMQAPMEADLRRRERILRHFNTNPGTSVRRAASVLGIPRITIWRTLRADRRHAYHVQKVQNLIPADYPRRLNFCNWYKEQLQNDVNLSSKVIWTDEATFTRAGIFNQRNYHLWAHENPRAVREFHYQHEFSVNVWVGLCYNGIIGPVFLPARLNAESYYLFLENDLRALLEDIPLETRLENWFQLDGCPAHYGRVVRDWLDINYPGRWIGRGGPVPWPPRSPDLTPLDFFVWGYVKENVYREPVRTRDDLIERIRMVCNQLTAEQCLDAVRSVSTRCDACIAARGQHFEQHLR